MTPLLAHLRWNTRYFLKFCRKPPLSHSFSWWPWLLSNFGHSLRLAYQISPAGCPAWTFKSPCPTILPLLPCSPESFNFLVCALTVWPPPLHLDRGTKGEGINSFARNQDSISYLSNLSLMFYIQPLGSKPLICTAVTLSFWYPYCMFSEYSITGEIFLK